MKRHDILLALAMLLAPAAAAQAQMPDGRTYAPGPFERLEIDGAGQVKVFQSDRDEVFVPGDSRMQEGVSIERSGSRLELNLPGAWKFWNADKAQVEVRMRHLSALVLSGAADVYAGGTFTGPRLAIEVAGAGVVHFDDLQVNQLVFSISGAGEGQLAGRVDQARVDVSGRGKLTAQGLQVRAARVSISGVGNADLWVTEALDVDISGAGHVRYSGQPRVRQSISGLGSVDATGEKR